MHTILYYIIFFTNKRFRKKKLYSLVFFSFCKMYYLYFVTIIYKQINFFYNLFLYKIFNDGQEIKVNYFTCTYNNKTNVT